VSACSAPSSDSLGCFVTTISSYLAAAFFDHLRLRLPLVPTPPCVLGCFLSYLSSWFNSTLRFFFFLSVVAYSPSPGLDVRLRLLCALHPPSRVYRIHPPHSQFPTHLPYHKFLHLHANSSPSPTVSVSLSVHTGSSPPAPTPFVLAPHSLSREQLSTLVDTVTNVFLVRLGPKVVWNPTYPRLCGTQPRPTQLTISSIQNQPSAAGFAVSLFR